MGNILLFRLAFVKGQPESATPGPGGPGEQREAPEPQLHRMGNILLFRTAIVKGRPQSGTPGPRRPPQREAWPYNTGHTPQRFASSQKTYETAAEQSPNF